MVSQRTKVFFLLWAEMGVDGVNVGAGRWEQGAGGWLMGCLLVISLQPHRLFFFFLVHNMERLSIPIEKLGFAKPGRTCFHGDIDRLRCSRCDTWGCHRLIPSK